MFNFLLRFARRVTTAACLNVVFLLPVVAQTDSVKTLAPKKLSEVVVQATRVGANAPVPHSNISAEVLSRQYHAQDVPYLL
ncbi:MAG: hypothetical protein SFV22_03760, partial [Saprospiraceae bacterium]|nr:hypothetical protein [Saprospiraceae bacterium]